MSAEQKEPEEIREEIAETREELGDTVEALAGKADVKGQAKAKVDSAKEDVKAKVDSARQSAQEKAGEFSAKAKETIPEGVGAGAQQVSGSARDNPVPVAVAAAFGAGVIVGWILSR